MSERYRLCSAALQGDLREARRLVEEEGEDPQLSMEYEGRFWSPVHGSCIGGHLDVLKYFIEERHCSVHCLGEHELTLLHMASGANKLEIVKYLIETCRCDPECEDTNGITPLHFACGSNCLEVVRYLIEVCRCDPKRVNTSGTAPFLFACANSRMDVVQYLVQACHCDPTSVRDGSGRTVLIQASEWGKIEFVKYLVEKCHCNTKDVDENGRTALHVASDIQVVRYLVEDCKCDPKQIDKNGRNALHSVASSKVDCLKVVEYLIETCRCDPECVDKDGWNPLHFASHHRHMQIVKYLLIVCQCDPKCTTKDGKTPTDLAAKHFPIVKDLIKAGSVTDVTLPQTPLKVFVVGNPATGKSSLTKALQNEASTLQRLFSGTRLVSNVEAMTAGIIPCQFSSKRFGLVTFYDFAGQQEYYASHAALLQSSILSLSSLFIIVVNLNESKADIKHKIAYWLFFLANQCTSKKPHAHVIIVGSHSDEVKSKGENPRDKLNIDTLKKEYKKLTDLFHITNFIPMDCRRTNSSDILNLANCIKEIGDSLRKDLSRTSFHLWHLLQFLQNRYEGLPAVATEWVLRSASSASIEPDHVPLAVENPEFLHKSFCKLHEAGHVIYINDSDLMKSWIVLDLAALLSDIGVLFAPEGSKQHTEFANVTGVMPVSRLAKKFPEYNIDMLVQFLCQLEFCREIEDRDVLKVISKTSDDSAADRYLFFPAKIRTDVPEQAWEENPDLPLQCGWMMQCHLPEEFFASRFLQVIILNIAFSCALASETATGGATPTDTVLTRRCSIWKNGIFWGTTSGVEALVEVREPPQNKEVRLLLRCGSEKDAVECAKLRSSVIQLILSAKKKLCPNISVKEFCLYFKEHDHLSNPHEELFSIEEISKVIVSGESAFVRSTSGTIHLNKVLLFEPYANLNSDILQDLFSGKQEPLKDKLIEDIAERIHVKKDSFIKILNPFRQSQLGERTRHTLGAGASSDPCGEFVCVIQCWMGDSGTYQSFQKALDNYSVFAGRNPMVS